MTFYYALWIPTTTKGIPAIIKDQLPKERFQDKPELAPFELLGWIDRGDYSVHLLYTLGKEKQCELNLSCIQKCEEGFLVYELELDNDEDSQMCESLQNGMKKAIYHYVKGFFHKHEYHSPSDDSLLNAFCSLDKILLSNPVHKYAVLANYLYAYELKYSGYVDECQDTINKVIVELEKHERLSKNVKLLRASIVNNLKIIEGEARYCDFLLSSCSDVVSKETYEKLISLRRDLISLNNRMVGIDNYLSSEVSIQKAETSIRWGIAGVVLAIIFFGYQFFADNGKDTLDEVRRFRQEQNETNDHLKQQLKEVNDKHDSLVHQIDDVKQKVEIIESQEKQ